MRRQLVPIISVPHTHNCGLGVKCVLMAATVSCLDVLPVLGRGTAAHSSIRDALAHMVMQCGLTDATVVETPATRVSGNSRTT